MVMTMSEPEMKEIQDFEKKDSGRVSLRERRKKEKTIKDILSDHETISMFVLFAAIVAAILVVVLSIAAFDVPVLAACVVIALNVAIALCLRDVPVWLHGMVLIVEIVTGFVVKKAVFMLLCAVVYLLVVVEFRFMRKMY